eukprot:12658034-Ditylum_brightwellii.AAC.1
MMTKVIIARNQAVDLIIDQEVIIALLPVVEIKQDQVGADNKLNNADDQGTVTVSEVGTDHEANKDYCYYQDEGFADQ